MGLRSTGIPFILLGGERLCEGELSLSRPQFFVQTVDNAIYRVHHYPVVCFVNTYPLDSDLSG